MIRPEPGAQLRWIDNHCHLGEDPAATLAAAAAAGVVRLIDVGCDLATSQSCLERARRHPEVYATVGLHPHEARHGVEGLEALLADPNVVAVGECGLDYHYDHSPRAEQRAAFATQIGWANECGLPLVIHTRDAWDETFAILDAEGVPERIVFHCFTGGPDEARACLDRGGWLSFSGIVSFRSAADVQAAARVCPLDRILVETDSPYLAPVPHRGKSNRPAWVSLVGEHLAALRNESVEAIAEATWSNAHRAYPRLGAAQFTQK